MSIGTRNISIGPRIGLGIGGIGSVTRDPISHILCPANTPEWAAVMAAAGNAGGVSALYPLQELSGNAVDVVGGLDMFFSGAGGLTYSAAVAGWARRAIATDASGTGNLRRLLGIPDVLTTSMLVLGYVGVTTTGTIRDVLSVGVTSVGAATTATNGFPEVISDGGNAVGTHDAGITVRPWVLCVNRTAALWSLYTDQDKVTLASGSPSGSRFAIGNGSVFGQPIAKYLYLALFFGAAAEMSAAQIKTLLQILGWTPTWS